MNPYTIYDSNCIDQILSEKNMLNKMYQNLIQITPTFKIYHAHKCILKGIKNGILCADVLIEGKENLDMNKLMNAGEYILLAHRQLSLGINELNKLKCICSEIVSLY